MFADFSKKLHGLNLRIINNINAYVFSQLFSYPLSNKNVFHSKIYITAFQGSTGKLVLLSGTRNNLFFKVFMIFFNSSTSHIVS